MSAPVEAQGVAESTPNVSEGPQLQGMSKPKWSDLLGICPSTPGPAPDITTADVRERYMRDVGENLWGIDTHSMADFGAAFDRWLAVHDAEVIADAMAKAGMVAIDDATMCQPGRVSWAPERLTASSDDAAKVAAMALRSAANAVDLRKAALAPGCDVDALDYDTPTDYGTDLAAWWLRARAAELGQP